MEVTIYSHETFKARAVKDSDSLALAIETRKNDRLWLFLDEAGANAIRAALDKLYPPAAEQAAERAAETAYADAHANDLPAPVPTVEQRAAMHDCTPAPKPLTPAEIVLAKGMANSPNPLAAHGLAAYNQQAVDMVAKACGLPNL